MTRIFNLSNIFELVINRLNEGPFTQQYSGFHFNEVRLQPVNSDALALPCTPLT